MAISRFHRTSDQMRGELLARIRRRYAVRVEAIELAEWTFAFTRVADPQRVLDDVVQAEEARIADMAKKNLPPLQVPYWAELWESSVALAGTIAQQVKPRDRVLDLGCGMGCTGAMAARTGAKVLLADIEPTALLLARLNTWPWRERVRTRRVNWQSDDLNERFDLIIGGDILYERSQWPHLHQFWLRHLHEGARVVLGEPGRATGDAFGEWAEKAGWSCESRPLVMASHPGLKSQVNFRVFTLRQSSGELGSGR